MLPRKLSFLLNAVIITFLINSSHTTLAKVSDTWEKREPQVTEAQKAAKEASDARLADMTAVIGKRNGEGTTPEKKPVEAVKPAEATKPAEPKPTPMAKPVAKPRAQQEAMNKAKATGGPSKSWREQLAEKNKLAREKREAPKVKPDEKEGVAARTKPPVKEEPAKAVEAPAAVSAGPSKAVDKPMEKATNIPKPPPMKAEPGAGGKPDMAEQMADKKSDSADKSKLPFLEEINNRRKG